MVKNMTRNRIAAMAAVLFIAGSVAARAQSKISNIEKLSGWTSCSACAGKGGNGPSTPHSMTRFITSPSLGTKSTRYSIGGSKPYAAALWWKQLGAKPNARNFVYDLYFYLKNPKASQALEFDVNQSVGGKKYIFGTECSIGRHEWDIWSAKSHWIPTGISCPTPAAYKWHHLTLEFQRTTGGQVKFVSVTLDGTKKYFNRTYAPKSSGSRELNVAFQMDGNKVMTDYDSWLEKVSLKYW